MVIDLREGVHQNALISELSAGYELKLLREVAVEDLACVLGSVELVKWCILQSLLPLCIQHRSLDLDEFLPVELVPSVENRRSAIVHACHLECLVDLLLNLLVSAIHALIAHFQSKCSVGPKQLLLALDEVL